tara:strand:- start:221 stop:472 length:252 start_codon:yes stop_codon:yes gene_type:complete
MPKHLVMYAPSTGYKRKDGYIKFVSAKISELLEKKEIKNFKLIIETTTNQTVEISYTIPETGEKNESQSKRKSLQKRSAQSSV